MLQYVQPDPPGRLVTIAVERVHRRSDRFERDHKSCTQLLAGGSEGDAAAGSVEQTHAQPRFQCFEGVAERRGADAELKSGATKAAMLRKREEIGEVGQIGAVDAHEIDSARTTFVMQSR
jgi:hypothetical protein